MLQIHHIKNSKNLTAYFKDSRCTYCSVIFLQEFIKKLKILNTKDIFTFIQHPLYFFNSHKI